QARDLKAGTFDAGNRWTGRRRPVGMGRTNYQVRRVIFELAALRSSDDKGAGDRRSSGNV
ncbi:hypothetical protein LCGC14_2026930, partial [marine sediment metagenome]